MNDVFARIGLALQHLIGNSTVNGPAREEVERLANELQQFEVTVPEMIRAEVQSQVNTALGEAMGAVNQVRQDMQEGLDALAGQLEALVPPNAAPPPATPGVAETPPSPPESGAGSDSSPTIESPPASPVSDTAPSPTSSGDQTDSTSSPTPTTSSSGSGADSTTGPTEASPSEQAPPDAPVEPAQPADPEPAAADADAAPGPETTAPAEPEMTVGGAAGSDVVS